MTPKCCIYYRRCKCSAAEVCNKMQCILAIQNFFDKTNGDTINYDSIVLCRTNFIGRDRNMLCQDLFDNCYEKFLFGIFNLGTLYQRKFMSVSLPHNL